MVMGLLLFWGWEAHFCLVYLLSSFMAFVVHKNDEVLSFQSGYQMNESRWFKKKIDVCTNINIYREISK